MNRSELPGEDLVANGTRDLARGVVSIDALLVSLAAPRLRRAGVPVSATLPDPEMRLYRLLVAEYGDAAHSRYNALVRRIVSYERAASCAT